MPAPDPFAPDADWQEYLAKVRGAAPRWAYDRDFVTSIALENLPAVCAALGTGESLGTIRRPKWWFSLANMSMETRRRHGLLPIRGTQPVRLIRLEPHGYDILFLDQGTGEWAVPNLPRQGVDLVSLAAWRWLVSDGKAAWRLAKLCGLRRPLP